MTSSSVITYKIPMHVLTNEKLRINLKEAETKIKKLNMVWGISCLKISVICKFIERVYRHMHHM